MGFQTSLAVSLLPAFAPWAGCLQQSHGAHSADSSPPPALHRLSFITLFLVFALLVRHLSAISKEWIQIIMDLFDLNLEYLGGGGEIKDICRKFWPDSGKKATIPVAKNPTNSLKLNSLHPRILRNGVLMLDSLLPPALQRGLLFRLPALCLTPLH